MTLLVMDAKKNRCTYGQIQKESPGQYGADDAVMIQLCLNCKHRSCIDCIGRISAGTKKAVRKEIEQGSIPFVVPEN